jgi:hypothetical protein
MERAWITSVLGALRCWNVERKELASSAQFSTNRITLIGSPLIPCSCDDHLPP